MCEVLQQCFLQFLHTTTVPDSFHIKKCQQCWSKQVHRQLLIDYWHLTVVQGFLVFQITIPGKVHQKNNSHTSKTTQPCCSEHERTLSSLKKGLADEKKAILDHYRVSNTRFSPVALICVSLYRQTSFIKQISAQTQDVFPWYTLSRVLNGCPINWTA